MKQTILAIKNRRQALEHKAMLLRAEAEACDLAYVELGNVLDVAEREDRELALKPLEHVAK